MTGPSKCPQRGFGRKREGGPIDDVSESAQNPSVVFDGPWEGEPSTHTASLRYDSPDALFREEYERLSRALTLVTGDVRLAEEAVQEAFARLCLNWARVSEYEGQAAWVRRVAVNYARDHHRSFLRKARFLLRLADSAPAMEPAPSMDPRVAEAIRRLPLKQRTAAALFYLADLSLADVAGAMSISEGAVKRHLSRARDGLRTILEERS